MFVYIENAHNISTYKPIFRYEGNNMDELRKEVRDYLNISEDNKVKLIVYDRRFGCTMRNELKSLTGIVGDDVYITLKLEDGNQ